MVLVWYPRVLAQWMMYGPDRHRKEYTYIYYCYLCQKKIKMSLSGIWTMQWTQHQRTRSIQDVTHGMLPHHTVTVKSHVHDLCTKSHFVQEKYDILIDGTVPALWVMHGGLEWQPRDTMGYTITCEYDCGMLYVEDPRALPITLLGYENRTLDMTYTLNMYDIIVMGAMSRVDRDVHQRLTLHHKTPWGT